MHSSWTSEDGRYLYSAREVTNSNGPSPGDVRVYDISNPATPLLVNRMSMSDLSLNAVTPHNPVVMGNKLYISWYQA
ncbi:selenium-binding family protein, partial [Escherichia coli]|nr:selenium-binding family protein [Escherichia coli]